MIGLELVVILGAVIVGCGLLGRRLRIADPILLLAGALLGLAPALREVHFPPELMLLVFLLVVLTAAVATAAHALGIDWGRVGAGRRRRRPTRPPSPPSPVSCPGAPSRSCAPRAW